VGRVEDKCTHECEECRSALIAAEQEAKEQRAKKRTARDGLVAALFIAMAFAEQADEAEARRAVAKLYYQFGPELPE
jgi:hypothetical protein